MTEDPRWTDTGRKVAGTAMWPVCCSCHQRIVPRWYQHAIDVLDWQVTDVCYCEQAD